MNRTCKAHTLLLLIATVLCITNHVYAQKTIQVIDQRRSVPQPFTHIQTDTNHYITNHQGFIQLDEFPESLSIKTLLQGDTLIHFNEKTKTKQDTIVVSINHKGKLPLIHYTSNEAEQLIRKVIANKKVNNPNKLSDFYYDTYNKFYIHTDKLDETKNIVDKILSVFSLKLDDFPENHHLVLSESVTQRRYHSKLNEDEIVIASRISGVDHSFLLAVNSQLQSFSLYEDFIRIANHKYVNPLTHANYHKHHFQIHDTIPSSSGRELVVIQFSPKANARFESLKGFLFIDTQNFGIERAWVYPAIIRGVKMNLYQQNKLLNDTLWFPDEYFTQIELNNIGTNELDFFASTHTVINNIMFNKNYTSKDFDEIAIQYNEKAAYSFNNEIIDSSRAVPLSPTDSNTYVFYDSVGSIKHFERVLNLGEKIYRKKVPLSFFNIHLNKVGNYNAFEGVRAGLGGQTNEKFSKHLFFGGYIGFGFRDRIFKYGVNTAFQSNTHWRWRLNVAHRNDVIESGAASFYLDRPQYSSEWIRNLRIQIMDVVRQNHVSVHFQPTKYLYGNVSLEQNTNSVLYNYQYKDHAVNNHFTTVGVHLKYAYGQRYFRLFNEKFPLDNTYPIIWLNIIKGLDGPLDGEYNFWKIEHKTEWTIPLPSWGVTRFQFISGVTLGDVPYFQLHRGRGSGQVLGLIHNSFETMGFNEFLSDRYLSLFLTHDFGYINFLKAKNFRPKFEVAYNAGVGGLSNPEAHQYLDFNTMENIFMEAGAMFNELLVINPLYFKVGFGIGYYYRFGAYQLGTFADNSVIKLSTRFKL